ncbi:hypothetical protein DPMN_167768 [Dreissena polymorpha]|uniref:Uncharacterized protein n=1 Tax=Dreissena polymorpha TaxID=45954 RepID=A0A9D4F1G2_DREPO|nr:hypothetical protein DPMN_167768 [Dreissena polymorpha]
MTAGKNIVPRGSAIITWLDIRQGFYPAKLILFKSLRRGYFRLSEQEAMINNIGGPGRVNYFFVSTECSNDQLNLKKMEIHTVIC